MLKPVIFLFCFLCSISSLRSQTEKSGTVSDIDGNLYRTVAIGKYLWMAENLRTTSWSDHTGIPYVEGNVSWAGLDSAGYCWYDDDKSKSGTFGALYNWFAVNRGNLCPDGWRVPSHNEWKYLEGYVDSLYNIGNPVWNNTGLRGFNAGKRLKAASGWRLGGNGTDDFGFSALPAGERLNSFNNTLGSSGFWWSSTEESESGAWYRSMIYAFDNLSRDRHPKRMGFSVRCIRDK
jgi:uncharacterized protein (TIGR02145 family)